MAGNAEVQKTVLNAFNGDACVGIDAIVDATGLTHRQVSNGACRLIQRGLLERAEVGCYRLTDDGRTAKRDGKPLSSGPTGALTQRKPRQPKRRTFRQRLWRAIGVHAARGSKFTVADLITTASSGGEANPESNATRYVACLHKAGYLRRYPKRAAGDALTSPGHYRYAVIKETGPEAPILRKRQTEVYDPNTGETVSCRNG